MLNIGTVVKLKTIFKLKTNFFTMLNFGTVIYTLLYIHCLYTTDIHAVGVLHIQSFFKKIVKLKMYLDEIL